MRRTIVAVAMAALLGLTGTLGMLPSASAGANAPCVTRTEYRRISVGMRQARVRRIFDTPGQRSDRQGRRETYVYEGCPRYVSVWVYYLDNEVTDKAWVRGE